MPIFDGVTDRLPSQVSSDPPVIMFSSAIPEDGRSYKDTVANIEATKEFVVNLISDPWLVNSHAASMDTPAGMSEWEITGLTREPSVRCSKHTYWFYRLNSLCRQR
jgi:flavin reductase (DIM6/NTAB) family NADH-FMN oxidoreductase RutF